MYCRYCGKPIPDDSDYCTHCGKSLYEIPINQNINNAPTSHHKLKKNFLINNISLLVKVSCYLALGIFLFLNIKMAPFYGGWKFLAYIIEGVVAIGSTILTIRKIANGSYLSIKILSLIFSILIIFSSITLRIVYDTKVDMVEKDVPSSGTILVDINWDTNYYSYIGNVVYDPSTSVIINDESGYTQITLGEPTKLEIKVKGNQKKDSTSDTITLYASDFINKKYHTTRSLYLEGGTSAKVEIELRRYCTFWEVIFY